MVASAFIERHVEIESLRLIRRKNQQKGIHKMITHRQIDLVGQ